MMSLLSFSENELITTEGIIYIYTVYNLHTLSEIHDIGTLCVGVGWLIEKAGQDPT